jgi:hypothetical protein
MSRLFSCGSGLILLFLSSAAAAPKERDERKHTPNPGSGTGIVFVVGGVGGLDPLGISAQWMLPRAGVHHEVREWIWTHGAGHFIKDLQDEPYLLRKASELSNEILEIKRESPDRPIFLLARSGGTGLVLAAAERLPLATLERIILLSAAVSPNRDLRPALRATKKEIVSFYSTSDRLILGWGTRQFGTVDRIYGDSAGLVGFKIPSGLSPEDVALYSRLVQVPWNARMILEGHLGTHLGSSMPEFVKKEIAPWLKP